MPIKLDWFAVIPGRYPFDGFYVYKDVMNTLKVQYICSLLAFGVPYNVSVRAMNGAPQSGVVTVIIAYVAQRRKF